MAAPQAAAGTLTILKPGDTSQVTSPIAVEADMTIGGSGSLRLELIGQNGRVMARKVYTFRECDTHQTSASDPLQIGEPASYCGGRSVHLSTDLIFNILEGNETARLQVIILDDTRRIVTQNSIDLTLIVQGTPKIESPDDRQGIILILPEEGTHVSEGSFTISGEAPVTNVLPMRVVVYSDTGKILGSRMVRTTRPGGQAAASQIGAFQVDIPLKIKTQQKVLITVTASDENIPGDRYIASRSVTLLP